MLTRGIDIQEYPQADLLRRRRQPLSQPDISNSFIKRYLRLISIQFKWFAYSLLPSSSSSSSPYLAPDLQVLSCALGFGTMELWKLVPRGLWDPMMLATCSDLKFKHSWESLSTHWQCADELPFCALLVPPNFQGFTGCFLGTRLIHEAEHANVCGSLAGKERESLSQAIAGGTH